MDLNLKLERKWKKEKYTIGNLYVNGVFFSNVLEDTTRGLRQDMTPEEIQKIKVYGETAIPAGKYEVRITLSARFRCPLPPTYQCTRLRGSAHSCWEHSSRYTRLPTARQERPSRASVKLKSHNGSLAKTNRRSYISK